MRMIIYLALACVTHALPPVEVMSEADASAIAINWWVRDGVTGRAGHTGSMKPYLEGGELILCRPYTGQSVQVGDLIVFSRWDKPSVIHRVEAVSATQFKAKGINNMFADGWYPFARIKFIVHRVIRIEREDARD